MPRAFTSTAAATLSDNDLSGNTAFAVTTTGAAVNASGNWWGYNSETGATDSVQSQISGVANVDYTPWLDSNTNLTSIAGPDYGLPGFYGDFSKLDVGDGGTQTGTTGRITEAIGDLTSGGTIKVYPGTYNESVTITESLTLESVVGESAPTISAPSGTAAVIISSSGVTVNGFTLAGAANWALDITAANADATIKNNVFQSANAGNVLVADASNTFTGNTFTAPSAPSEPDFLQFQDSSSSASYTATGEITTLLASGENNSFNRAVTVENSAGGYLGDVWANIQAAVNAASSGDTVNVAAGTYLTPTQVVIDQNVSIVGAGMGQTIIQPGFDTTDSGDSKGWFLVGNTNPSVVFNLSDATLDGTGHLVFQAIRDYGSGAVNAVAFNDIEYNASGPDYAGTGLVAFGTASVVSVTNSTFTNIGREGVLFYGPGTTGTYSGNTYTGKGDGNWLDYAVEVGAGASATISGNTISGNTGVAKVDGSTSAGIIVSTYYRPGTTATITDNLANGNTEAVAVGYDDTDTSVVTISGNDLAGNFTDSVSNTSTLDAVNAFGNWWGSANGPTTALNAFADPVSLATGGAVIGSATIVPWLTDGTNYAQPGSAGFVPATLDTAPPVVTPPTSPQSATKGAATTLTLGTATDADGSLPSGQYTVTVNWGDQSTPYSFSITNDLTSFSLGTTPLSHTYAEYGQYTATVTVVNNAGNSSAPQTFQVNVGDAALSAVSLTPPAATEGIAFSDTPVFHFTDAAGIYAKIADYTAVVQLGDGNSVTLNSSGVVSGPGITSAAGASGQIVTDPSGGYDVQLSYTYAEEIQAAANATFSVQVTDAGGAEPISSGQSFTVADAALSAVSLTPPVATEGIAFTNTPVFHFTDAAGSYAKITDYTAVVQLGDGNSVTLNSSGVVSGPGITNAPGATGQIVAATGGGYSVQLSYTYGDEIKSGATFSVQVTNTGSATHDFGQPELHRGRCGLERRIADSAGSHRGHRLHEHARVPIHGRRGQLRQDYRLHGGGAVGRRQQRDAQQQRRRGHCPGRRRRPDRVC